MNNIIKPNWPAPANIKAYSTTRVGGFSQNNYASFNLGLHVSDVPQLVEKNRKLLRQIIDLNSEPLWLNQVHDNYIVAADNYANDINADGCYALKPQQVCVIMTADCLPILLTNKQGTIVMALHGGWRSLASGIIEKGINIVKQLGDEILVWLGPAISKAVYEVGDEVRAAFITNHPTADGAFKRSANQRWLMDIYAIARIKFAALGIKAIYADENCTFENKQQFFSYRRDGATGRMASLIYIAG